MKNLRCDNCKRTSEVSNNVKMVLCGCGYEMKEIMMASEVVNNANFEQTDFRSMFFKKAYDTQFRVRRNNQ